MRRTGVHGAGTGSGVEAPNTRSDAPTEGSRPRVAAPEGSAAPRDVDDDRDIFGDAGLGRVDDGRDVRPRPGRGDRRLDLDEPA